MTKLQCSSCGSTKIEKISNNVLNGTDDRNQCQDCEYIEKDNEFEELNDFEESVIKQVNSVLAVVQNIDNEQDAFKYANTYSEKLKDAIIHEIAKTDSRFLKIAKKKYSDSESDKIEFAENKYTLVESFGNKIDFGCDIDEAEDDYENTVHFLQ